MTLKLLTEHHLEFLSLKGGSTGSSESTLVQNATLLEITCHGSYMFWVIKKTSISKLFFLVTKIYILVERFENNQYLTENVGLKDV